MKLFRNESSNAKWNAQRSLSGLTHYVEDDSLRFHKSRILSTYITDGGLLFTLIESVALDMNNTRRGFRYVIFDVFGTVVSRLNLEDSFASKEQARKAMWKALNALDAKAHTLDAIAEQQRRFARECDEMRDIVVAMETAKAAA